MYDPKLLFGVWVNILNIKPISYNFVALYTTLYILVTSDGVDTKNREALSLEIKKVAGASQITQIVILWFEKITENLKSAKRQDKK